MVILLNNKWGRQKVEASTLTFVMQYIFVTDTKEWALQTEQDETNVDVYGMFNIVDSFTTLSFPKMASKNSLKQYNGFSFIIMLSTEHKTFSTKSHAKWLMPNVQWICSMDKFHIETLSKYNSNKLSFLINVSECEWMNEWMSMWMKWINN